MDENVESSNPQLESPKIYIPKPTGSGLTLVIPSLKSLKASNSQTTITKPKHSVSHASSIYPDDAQEKKTPRPTKLKPLKEVLTKLITQIKRFFTFSDFLEVHFAHLFASRKDDYAFFLAPVDVANVPGYSDVVKARMDFGTMTNKVKRGKYRSLDEFTVSGTPYTLNYSLTTISVGFQVGYKQRESI